MSGPEGHIRLTPELTARVDALRGTMSRNAAVAALVDTYLDTLPDLERETWWYAVLVPHPLLPGVHKVTSRRRTLEHAQRAARSEVLRTTIGRVPRSVRVGAELEPGEWEPVEVSP